MFECVELFHNTNSIFYGGVIMVDIMYEIERIIKLTRNQRNKKLKLIEEHLRANYNKSVQLHEIDDLKEYLSREANDDIITDIYELLDQTFSKGDPYYIIQFEIQEDKSQKDLLETIEIALPKDKDIYSSKDNFVLIKRISDVNSISSDHLTFMVKYEKYQEVIKSGQRSEQGPVDVQTSFEIFFDFQINLCYIKCGDTNQFNSAFRVMKRHMIGIFNKFSPFRINTLYKFTKFEGELELDKQTTIILDYLDDELNKDKFSITDYTAVTFANPRSDKVRSVRIGGSNLFESPEFAERIRFSDRIRSVKFQIYKETNTNPSTGVLSNIRIYFDSTLKFVFNEMENNAYQRDFVQHLFNSLINSLNKTYYAHTIKLKIQELIRVVEAKDSLMAQKVLEEIIPKIEREIEDENTRLKVLSIINSYVG